MEISNKLIVFFDLLIYKTELSASTAPSFRTSILPQNAGIKSLKSTVFTF